METLMLEVITALKQAKWKEDRQRRARATRNIDFFDNNHYPYIEAGIESRFDNSSKYESGITPATFVKKYKRYDNLTEVIITEKSTLLKKPAKITITNSKGEELSETQQKAFQKILNDIDLDANLHETEKQTNLNRDTALLPQIVTVDGEQTIILDIITPDGAFVKQKDGNPTEAEEFYYSIGTDTDSPDTAKEVIIYNMWNDAGEKYELRIDDSTGVKADLVKLDNQIQYGYNPITMFRNYTPKQTFWNDKHNYTVDENLEIDLLKTAWNISRNMNIPMLVLRGYPEGQEVKSGWSFVTAIPADKDTGNQGDAGYINPNAPIETEAKLILSSKEQVASANKLSPSIFTSGEKFSSGYHAFISKQDLLEYTDTLRKHYTKSIKRLLKVICKTAEGIGIVFPEDIDFTIDYAEVSFIQSPEEKAKVRALKTQQGIWSAVQSLMDDNPDMDEKAAIKELERIQRLRKLEEVANPFEDESEEDDE